MKGKLIKDEDGYSLFTREENSTNRKFIATTQGMYVDHKLSKQNCDEIFGVVDVEKLAEESVFDGFRTIWKNGFNKAMELNKDKLFTVEELRYAFYTGMKHGSEGGIMFGKALADEYVQSLQQPTEIEVEIVTEEFESYDEILNAVKKPILDSNGCLILEKI
jgi:hypothetical protein